MLLEQRSYPKCFSNDDTVGGCHVSPLGTRLRLGQSYMMTCKSICNHQVVRDDSLRQL